MSLDSFTLRVTDINDESDCVRSFRLASVTGAPLPAWEPGAHLDVVLPSGLVRQYSLCGDPECDTEYQIAVLREPASRGGSVELHDQVVPGQQLQVRGPKNHFELHPAPAYLFIAGGVGITPLLPMLRRASRQGVPWRLVYGGRGRKSMAFLDHLMTETGGSVDVVAEDERGLPALDDEITNCPADSLIYTCGPEGLLRAVEAKCAALGRSDALHLERFAASSELSVADTTDTAFEIELRQSGRVCMVPQGTSILDVVRTVVPEWPSSCTEGFCGTCETRVLGGVPDHRDTILSDEEREANDTMMICVGRSKSPRLVLDL